MLSKFSVKKPYTVVVGIIMVIILGFVSYTNMTADLLPSMNLPYAIVITTYPGASPEEVEAIVTKPIEQSMATISNIKNISSTSSPNYSMVMLEFEQISNMDSATIEMRESLDQIGTYWNESISNPIIMKLNPDMLPIMVASVDVEGLDSTQITEYVEQNILTEIESIEGVASVSTMGSIVEEIQVMIRQEKIDEVNKQITASLDDKFEEAKEELDSAQSEITSGKDKLEAGQKELAGQLSQAEVELNNKKLELVQTEDAIRGKIEEMKQSLTFLNVAIDGLKSLNETATTLNTLQNSIITLQDSKTQLESLLALTDEMLLAQGLERNTLEVQLAAVIAQIAAIEDQLAKQNITSASLPVLLAELEKQLGKQMEGITSGGTVTLDTLASKIAELEGSKPQIEAGIVQMEQALQDIATGKTTLSAALAEINKNQILGSIEMGSASAGLASGEQKMEEAQKTFEDSKEDAYEKASLHNIVTIDMVTGILNAQNFSMPAGYITEDNVEYLVRVGDKITSETDLSELVILDMGMEGVAPIKLLDVADIIVTDNTADTYSKINGNPGIMLSMQKQTGYSTGEVTNKINAKFESLEQREEGIHFANLMDQGIYIDYIVKSVVQNMLYGGILAIIILLFFLKDIKPTIVIAFSIPISILVSIVLMYFSGVTINVISLSGLALGVGMLVDNSIVVIENIYRLRSEGNSAKTAAVEGAKQVSGAIVASTLTTICVFAPIVFTQGITRQLFVEMGLTIAYSLLASLLIALTLVPMMGAGLLKNTKEKTHPILERIQYAYGQFLGKALKFKALVFLFAIVLLIASIYGAIQNGIAFMPEMESTQITVNLTTDKEKTLEETGIISDQAVEKLLEIKDIELIGAMAGGGGMMGMGEASENAISMYVILKEDKVLSSKELSKQILEKTKDLDCEISVNTSSMDMSALGGSGIAVQVRGRDLEQLQKYAEDVAIIVKGVKGTIEVSNGMEETTPELQIKVDKAKAAEYKLTVAQVFQELNKKIGNTSVATTLSTDTKDYKVYIVENENETLTREDVKDLTMKVTNAQGEEEDIALTEFVTFEEADGLTSIQRDNQERYITVTAGIDSEHNVGNVSAEIQKELDKMDILDGYTLVMAGEDETIMEAMEQIGLMLALAVAFIYLIMVAQFQSLLSPFIIMFTIPLAFTGGFLGLIISNSEISVIALIGFVMLAGIIVNNGIVLVDYINQLRKSGMDQKEAIMEAGQTRLRPILMTALTTILGLSTMAFGVGMGSDMVQPMAIVTIGGLLYGTLLTLIVVPCIYDAFNRNKSMVEEEF